MFRGGEETRVSYGNISQPRSQRVSSSTSFFRPSSLDSYLKYLLVTLPSKLSGISADKSDHASSRKEKDDREEGRFDGQEGEEGRFDVQEGEVGLE